MTLLKLLGNAQVKKQENARVKLLENVGLIYCYYLRKLVIFAMVIISKIRYLTDVLHVSSVILHSDNKKTCHVSSSKLEIIILDLDLNNFIIAY
ncbi:hypothetical protein [Ligilactobacillus salivarius]|uniref:hypothetical protein n=1 Tax=Ligilactobacillus salivarius TaxID=1624 RepID=UPI00117AA357|nr:hypothetical protein [Ligilactobacillus salivarius]